MAHIWKDRVKETATTTGTGSFTLAGAVDRFRAFSSVCATNDTFEYTIEGAAGTGEWETGYGTYSGTNTLARTLVRDSSNAGAAVNFSAGTKTVILSANAHAFSNRPVVLNAMRPLSDFTQIAISGAYTATEYPGRALVIEDTAPGSGFQLAGLRRAVPSAPYRIVVALQPATFPVNYLSWAWGFTDGTKFHLLGQYDTYNQSETTWSNTTTRISSTQIYGGIPIGTFFVCMEDDNAGNCYIGYSANGAYFTSKKIVKSSGYLGSSGYTSACVLLSNLGSGGLSGAANKYSIAIREWDESGLTRTFA